MCVCAYRGVRLRGLSLGGVTAEGEAEERQWRGSQGRGSEEAVEGNSGGRKQGIITANKA